MSAVSLPRRLAAPFRIRDASNDDTNRQARPPNIVVVRAAPIGAS